MAEKRKLVESLLEMDRRLAREKRTDAPLSCGLSAPSVPGPAVSGPFGSGLTGSGVVPGACGLGGYGVWLI